MNALPAARAGRQAHQEAPVNVGDRVRILDPGDCDFWVHQEHNYEVGATGEIVELKPAEHNAGHIYQVQFDEPRPHPPGHEFPRLARSIYAPHEVEPAP